MTNKLAVVAFVFVAVFLCLALWIYRLRNILHTDLKSFQLVFHWMRRFGWVTTTWITNEFENIVWGSVKDFQQQLIPGYEQLYIDSIVKAYVTVTNKTLTSTWHTFVGLSNSFCHSGQNAACKLSPGRPCLHLIGKFYAICLVLFPRQNLRKGTLKSENLRDASKEY